MRGAAVFGHLLLQRRHLWTEDRLAGREDPKDRRFDFGLKFSVLRLKVTEWDWRGARGASVVPSVCMADSFRFHLRP